MTTYADLLNGAAEQIRIGAGELRTDRFWSADEALAAIGDFHAVLDAVASHTRRLLWPAQIQRIGFTSHRDGLPPNERAAIALAAGIEALVGAARPHPSQLSPATTPWLRAALHLRAASDLVATHFHPDGSPRTPDASRPSTRAFDAGLVDLGHLAATILKRRGTPCLARAPGRGDHDRHHQAPARPRPARRPRPRPEHRRRRPRPERPDSTRGTASDLDTDPHRRPRNRARRPHAPPPPSHLRHGRARTPPCAARRPAGRLDAHGPPKSTDTCPHGKVTGLRGGGVTLASVHLPSPVKLQVRRSARGLGLGCCLCGLFVAAGAVLASDVGPVGRAFLLPAADVFLWSASGWPSAT